MSKYWVKFEVHSRCKFKIAIFMYYAFYYYKIVAFSKFVNFKPEKSYLADNKHCIKFTEPESFYILLKYSSNRVPQSAYNIHEI